MGAPSGYPGASTQPHPLGGKGAFELLDLRSDALLGRFALVQRVVEGVVELLGGRVGADG